MSNPIELDPKQQSLIAVGASVASGCRPCTAYHVKAVRGAGACETSLALAIETALAGRAAATLDMSQWAAHCQGPAPEIGAEFRERKQLLAELIAIATAVAVNSVPELQKHISAARAAGAQVEQMRAAIAIARDIKRVAEEKIAAVTSALDTAEPASTGASACCSSSQPEPPAGASAGCGCR